MRRWFVLLLIALLPWRAWAGDAMMLSMTPSPEPRIVVAETAAVPHCAEHAADDAAHPGEPSGHAVCDICNGPLLAVPPWSDAGQVAAPQTRLSAGPVLFASAVPRSGLKPPIA